MFDADQASSHPWVWTKIWPWYIVFHLCRILSGWLQGTGVPLPPSSSPDWRTASRPSCTCRPLGKERWRANVGISLKKDCRVSWFESTELLPKRWPKIDPRRGSGTKMSKTSQTLISKNCHSKLVGNLITIRIWSKNNQSFNGNLRRDFKGDYCDLEPLDGAKQLLRTGFFPAVGDVSRVCDLSIWNHECFFKTSLGELGCLLKE